jgi:hypothetical protein
MVSGKLNSKMGMSALFLKGFEVRQHLQMGCIADVLEIRTATIFKMK